jgi:type I restriction enzyme S subunit
MANVSSSNGLEKRPKLRFPGFDEPWKVFKAEELFQNVTDKNHPDETVLTIIQGKGTLPREQAGRNIHYDDASLSNYKKVEQGDFIIHLRSFEGGLEMANEAGIVSPAYTILRCKRPHSSLFYDAYFHTDEFINHNLSKSVEGIRDGRQISYEAFKWLGIPYCEPTEQEKISSLFSVLNERIAKQRDLVESLKKYKRGLLHDVLSEKIKITTETWTEHRIGEFLHSKNIKQLPTTDAPLMAFTATGGVCDKGERYDRGFLVKDASSKLYKRTDLNDFIYSSNNLDVGSIGLNFYGSAVISDVYEIFSIKDADPWFISEAIKQKPIMCSILKYRQGCLYGQYRIYAEDFLGVSVKIPSYEAQKKIGDVFSKIDGKITQEQILLDCLEKARTFFLQQLFI